MGKATTGQSRQRHPSGDGKNLVIVESPAKAKTINRYLGDAYVVSASMGHVRDLPRKDLSVDLDHDFEPTYEVVPERRKVLAALKKQARHAAAVYLATDLDREGEAIAWHLAESLDVPGDRIRRVTFNEITASAITEAFEHPRSLEMNRVNAQQARRILDRIVGYQISPLLWRKVATGLSAGRVQSVAVRLVVDREREIEAFMPEEFWRLEAVFTSNAAAAPQLHDQWMRFLAARDAKGAGPTRDAQQDWLGERQCFWAELTHLGGKKVELADEAAARRVAEALGVVIEGVERTEHPDAKGPARQRAVLKPRLYDPAGPSGLVDFKVASLDERRSLSRPPKPFTTASLQQAASARLRFSASRTMRVAQQLYEGVAVGGEGSVGLITYMRTDSLNLSNEAIGSARQFIGDQYGGDYVPQTPNRYVAGGRAQEAHEAIRPTDVRRTPASLRGSLAEPQLRLYRLIWERFVACQMTPAVWSVTDAVVTAGTSAGEARFRAVGRRLVFDGFMKVTGVSERGDQILPELGVGQPLGAVQLDPQQRFTQPPPRYTEASLVRALEAEGIGRPSTYASIIQTIQDRAYVEQIDRRFFATEVGIKVTDKLVEHFPRIMDLRFTAHMEDQLDRIEAEDLDWVQVLREFYGPFAENLHRAMGEMQHAKAESEPSQYTCEACGRPMVYRWSRNGKYLACTGYPECKTTHPVDREGKKIEQKVVAGACPQCGSDMILRRSRFGPFLGCTRYPECRGTLPCDAEGNPLKVMKDEDVTGECPACGAKMEVKRKGRRAFLGCTRYPACDGTAPIPEGIHLQAPPKPPPQDTGLQCPKCRKKNLVVRQGPRGEFVACSGFPRCRNSFNMSLLDQVKAALEAGQDAQPIIDQAKGGEKTAKKAARKAGKAKKASTRRTAKKAAPSASDE
ncbi:MAG: type I DNA topoisomerase [Planctomycetes bacterium]|nr:type I DNA topoisomerase [Planctomycetota bacterium]